MTNIPSPRHSFKAGRAPRGRSQHRRSTNSHSLSNKSVSTPSTPPTSQVPLESNAVLASGSQNTSIIRPGNASSTSTLESEEMKHLRLDLQSKVEHVNTLKATVHDLNTKLSRAELTEKVLHEKLISLEAEVSKLKKDKDGLLKLNDQLQLKLSSTATTTPKFVTKLSTTLEKKYLCLALAVERQLAVWSSAESMELKERLDPVKQRNWTGRMSVVDSHGIVSPSSDNTNSFTFVPTVFSAVLSSSNLLYIQSFVSIDMVIAQKVRDILQNQQWSSFRSSSSIETETVNAISNNKVLIAKTKQMISDAFSNRKRAVRDELFISLNYFSLKTSHDRRYDRPLFSKHEEIEIAQQKLVHEDASRNLRDYSWWRITPITSITSNNAFPEVLENQDLTMDRPEPETLPEGRQPSPDDDRLLFSMMGIFRNEIAHILWKTFIGFDPQLDEDNQTETTFLSIPRLDAWIATVVDLLAVQEKRGGGRQRDYNNLFQKHMVKATYQLVSRIFDYVEFWAEDEVSSDIIPEDDPKSFILTMERNATKVLFSPNDSTYYIAIQSKWFSEFISPNMGIVHDSYIAKISSDFKSITKLIDDSIDDNTQENSFLSDHENYELDNDDILPDAPSRGSTPGPSSSVNDSELTLAPTTVPPISFPK